MLLLYLYVFMSLWLCLSIFSLSPSLCQWLPLPFSFCHSHTLSVLQSLRNNIWIKVNTLSLSLSFSLCVCVSLCVSLTLSLSHQIFISPSFPFRYYVIFLEFETFFNPQQPAWIKAFSTKLTIDLERKYLPLQDTPMWDVFIKHFGKKKTGKLKVYSVWLKSCSRCA